MKKQIKKRIRSRAGETIAEVLISVLISALALSLLAGMVFAARNMVESSKASTARYVQAGNHLVERSEGDGVTKDISKKVTSSLKLSDSTNGSKTVIPVTTYTIDGSKPSVVSYKR